MTNKPKILLLPNSYQPGKQEMLEDVSINTTPDELADAVWHPVKIVKAEPTHPRQLN